MSKQKLTDLTCIICSKPSSFFTDIGYMCIKHALEHREKKIDSERKQHND